MMHSPRDWALESISVLGDREEEHSPCVFRDEAAGCFKDTSHSIRKLIEPPAYPRVHYFILLPSHRVRRDRALQAIKRKDRGDIADCPTEIPELQTRR